MSKFTEGKNFCTKIEFIQQKFYNYSIAWNLKEFFWKWSLEKLSRLQSCYRKLSIDHILSKCSSFERAAPALQVNDIRQLSSASASFSKR